MRTCAQGREDMRIVTEQGGDHDGAAGLSLRQRLDQGGAVAVGQAEVDQGQVDDETAIEQSQSLAQGRGMRHLHTGETLTQQGRQPRGHVGQVFQQ